VCTFVVRSDAWKSLFGLLDNRLLSAWWWWWNDSPHRLHVCLWNVGESTRLGLIAINQRRRTCGGESPKYAVFSFCLCVFYSLFVVWFLAFLHRFLVFVCLKRWLIVKAMFHCGRRQWPSMQRRKYQVCVCSCVRVDVCICARICPLPPPPLFLFPLLHFFSFSFNVPVVCMNVLCQL
jgi:hypothetical protein